MTPLFRQNRMKHSLFFCLVLLMLVAGTTACLHNHDDYSDGEEGLLCPICLVLAQHAAVVFFLFLYSLVTLRSGLPDPAQERPRLSPRPRSRHIRAPPA